MPVHFIISIFAYIIMLILVGIAYISHLIETSKEYRENHPAHVSDYLLWFIILSWPITGLHGAITANDDKYISPIETLFIVLEISFWFPILVYFIQMWLF